MLSPLTDGWREGQLPALAATRKKGQKGSYLAALALISLTSTTAGWKAQPDTCHSSSKRDPDSMCWFGGGTALSTSPRCKDLQAGTCRRVRASDLVLAATQAWVPVPFFLTETPGTACPCLNPFRDQALMPGCCCLPPPTPPQKDFMISSSAKAEEHLIPAGCCGEDTSLPQPLVPSSLAGGGSRARART